MTGVSVEDGTLGVVSPPALLVGEVAGALEDGTLGVVSPPALLVGVVSGALEVAGVE